MCDDCAKLGRVSRVLSALGGPIDGATVPLSLTRDEWAGFLWLHVPVLNVAMGGSITAAIYARDGDLLLYVDADDYRRETHGGDTSFRIDP